MGVMWGEVWESVLGCGGGKERYGVRCGGMYVGVEEVRWGKGRGEMWGVFENVGEV